MLWGPRPHVYNGKYHIGRTFRSLQVVSHGVRTPSSIKMIDVRISLIKRIPSESDTWTRVNKILGSLILRRQMPVFPLGHSLLIMLFYYI